MIALAERTDLTSLGLSLLPSARMHAALFALYRSARAMHSL